MRWYWAAWILVGFLAPEMWALLSGRPENTLSDTVWHWCDVTPGKTVWTWSILHLLLAFFLVWLFGHMVFRWWARL